MSKSLLKVNHLCWSVKDKAILNDISFAVEKGERVGIIGPNGAGKTSILKAVYRSISDFSGDIWFQQKSIQQYQPKELARHLAVVSQHNTQVFSLTVLEMVEMGLTPHLPLFSSLNDYHRHQVDMALEKVGLADRKQQVFSALSGGEQQRALLARALVQQARLLILDEPTNHLDIYYQHQVLQLVKQLNISVLMTIHDLNLAAQYCDRLILIDSGQVVAQGAPEEVLTEEYLQQTFKLPCQCSENNRTGYRQVEFFASETEVK